ncbi:MAG: hypothetical protein HZB14_09685 [Actinobacteria bacterium]|nr:hypothetical protein [Actinomycetota bacterium]
MSSLEAKMLENIVKALAHHDQTCPMPAQAILLSSFDHERFGWDEVKGVPVQAADGIQPERFRIQCEGSAAGIEDAVEEFAITPRELPVEVPVGPVPAITPARTPFADDFDDPPDPYRW